MTANDMGWLGAAIAFILAIVTLARERGKISAWFFSLGMILAAIESLLGIFSVTVKTPEQFFLLQLWKAYILAFLPGVWLLFSLSYGRGRSFSFIKEWRVGVAAMFLLPLILVVFFREHLFTGVVKRDPTGAWLLVLGWAGQMQHICTLAGWILVLMNLERTIRASVGIVRWQIKYMIFGLLTLIVARIYTSSQAVLFRSTFYSLEVIKVWALFVSSVAIGYSYTRAKPFKIDVYPSQAILSRSIVGLMAGVYLFVMGVFAQMVTWLGGDRAFPIKALIILISFFGLGVILFSERLRHRIKHWVSVNFRRSLYDYRQLWTTFTARTSSAVDETALSRAVVKWISETFEVLSVNMWLLDESKKQLRFGGSTFLSEADAEGLLQQNKVDLETLQTLARQPQVFDLDKSQEPRLEFLQRIHPENFRKAGHRLCIRLMEGDELLGFFTVGDRVDGIPYSLEDFDLLKCVSVQVAAGLHHRQLSRRLLDAKEMATFQTMSAFFVHDLKNTASTLSLMLQNLPVHFDDAAFRQDALRAIGKCAQRINELIERLTQLRQDKSLNLVETNLNDVLAPCLSALKPVCQAELVEDLQPLPLVALDPEQIQKVVTNLILNANDASPKGAQIVVATRQQNGWVTFSVSDNGCGMTTEFMSKSLFRPFQTTKKKGIGIGLFHCKIMVEAHHGKIETESELGKGTTFRVLLPLKKELP